jgi:hypothetical protein
MICTLATQEKDLLVAVEMLKSMGGGEVGWEGSEGGAMVNGLR